METLDSGIGSVVGLRVVFDMSKRPRLDVVKENRTARNELHPQNKPSVRLSILAYPLLPTCSERLRSLRGINYASRNCRSD